MTGGKQQDSKHIGYPQSSRKAFKVLKQPVEEECPQPKNKSTEGDLLAYTCTEKGQNQDRETGMYQSAKAVDRGKQDVADYQSDTTNQPQNERDEKPAPPVTIFLVLLTSGIKNKIWPMPCAPTKIAKITRNPIVIIISREYLHQTPHSIF